MNQPSEKHRYLFWGVVLTALFIHAGILIYAHGQKIASSSLSNRAFMENHAPQNGIEEILSREEEIKQRNEQIATLFQQLQQPHESSLSSSTLHQAPEVAPSKIEIDLQSQMQEIDHTPFAVLVDPSSYHPQEADFAKAPQETDHNVSQHDDVAHELILAAESAYGKVEPQETTELIQASIQAGNEEGTSLGTALHTNAKIKGQADLETSFASNFDHLSEIHRSALLEQNENGSAEGGKSSSTGLGTIASSSDFNLDIQIAPRRNGEGFLFRVELVPKPEVKFRHIVQNYFFLIDRSPSIRPSRFEYSRQAIAKALEMLQPGDTFNLFFFDDRISAFSSQNVPWTAANVAAARNFLTHQRSGGIYSTTDLYSSLGKIVPEAVADNEVNTAILLSDGDTFLSLDKQRASIGQWTHQNLGKVSLYSVASGSGNNLALLDVLSFFNKGILYYSPTDKDIDKALFKLMHAVHNPIGKQMTITVLKPSPEVEISLYPSNSTMPNLYEHSPFVVYGSINRLQDFHLFFQGRYYERTLDIKKLVTFAEAKMGNVDALEKRMALFQAYAQYAEYMRDGRASHLADAKQLLAPYKIQVAFQ